jgi:hypothetical protein
MHTVDSFIEPQQKQPLQNEKQHWKPDDRDVRNYESSSICFSRIVIVKNVNKFLQQSWQEHKGQ